MRRPLALLALLGLLALAGCGGGGGSDTGSESSSASTSTTSSQGSDGELRSSFVQAVRSKLASSGLPGGYVSCVVGKAEQVPTDQLRTLGGAAVFSGDNKAAVALGKRLGKECIAEGAGVNAFRQLMIATVKKGLAAKGASAAFENCFTQKFSSEVSDAELSAILLKYVSGGGGGAAQSAGQQIGRRVARECQAAGISP